MAANLEGLAQPPEEQPEQEARRALVIAAHPDDADFGAAGTACLWSRQGWQFYYPLFPNRAQGNGRRAPAPRPIRQLRPHAVFTHDPEAVIVRDAFINHSDHRATGLVAVDAVYPAAPDRPHFPEQVAGPPPPP